MVINDKDLGEIRLVENKRARRIIVRRKDDHLQLTYPPSITISYIEKTIAEMKPRLKSLIEKKPDRITFSPESEFSTFSFRLQITTSISASNFYMNLKDGKLSISCPADTVFGDDSVQTLIRNCIEKALRYEANRIFPSKVKDFAQEYGFKYTGVKINKSRTRWGSCSSKKSINLSYYCMLLPEHLADFVILHELCHTVEMNHGEKFWQLLDNISGGKSKELTSELRLFKTVI
ncbi:MAG: M48 family metallopeptidase [Prevotella sp.]|jgi:predicted metal-dependent hydrolase|nr:M48 family metallopeptidase [Prevotella sp.]